MDIAATLAEIQNLSVEDRLRIVHAIWDGIAEPDVWEPTAAQKRELDRRVAALDADPNDVISWEELRTRLRQHRS